MIRGYRHPIPAKALLFCTVLLLFPVWMAAQGPFFRLIRTPDPLRSTLINCLCQDSLGTLWLGTGQGLYRYDGRTFDLVPAPSGPNSLQVSAIFMDAGHMLWVGTKTGGIYRLREDSLVAFQPEEGLPKMAITGFAADGRGNLWFSTYGEGLYYYNGHHIYNINTNDGLTDDFCYTIVSDAYGRIWVATDEGISICYASEKMKKVDKITTLQGLPDNIVLSIARGQNGLMWAGMQDGGVCSVNPNTMKANVPAAFNHWKYGPVKDLLVFNNILWLATDKNGILEVDPASSNPPLSYTGGENCSFPKVNQLLADLQGNCWISAGSDLILSPGPGFKRISAIGKSRLGSIQSILTDRQGKIWYSTEGHLFRFSPLEYTRKPPREYKLPLKKHTHIISLYQDSMGFIWAGTFGEGLLRINPVTGSVMLINERNGLANGNILSIAGRGREIWLATLGGAFRCTISGNKDNEWGNLRFENFSQENGPGNNYIYSVFIDSKNRVWFGTDGRGISMFENGRFTVFGEKEGIKGRVVYSITEDMDHAIWFSTSTSGVYKYDGRKFRNYGPAGGLSNLQISSIAADNKHHVLFAHDHGFDVLDTRSDAFIYYGSELNLDAINPDLNVISGNGSGQFWLGTQEGIIRLEIPSDTRLFIPALQLNRVEIFLGQKNYIGQHEFSWEQNHISFYFNAFWASAPDQVTYQIKLEGYDLDWINTRNNLVTYSSLPPGKYTFRLRSALKGNYTYSQGLSWPFVISKPFWKTSWFMAAMLVLITGLAFIIIRLRDASMKRKEALERERLIFQLQTMRSQVNPHFLFNSFSTLMSVIDEDKEMAIEYVQKLSQFFRNILEYRDKDLIPLSEELILLESYSYLQKQRYGESFRMQITIEQDKLSTLIPPLAIQMMVENAIKHNVVSAEKPLLVRVFTEGRYLYIRNNLQRKKLPEPSTGVGLMNIKSRYRLLGYENLNVQETTDEFIIKLPLIKP